VSNHFFLALYDQYWRVPGSSLSLAVDTVRRFLRADRGNISKAKKRLEETLKWRIDVQPQTKMCSTCLNEDLRSHYMQHVGWDKRGRALVYSDIGMARDKGHKSNVEHCIQVLELMEPILPPFPNDQYIWVVDFHKFSISDMNPKMAIACLKLFGRSYPERLGQMILVGAPRIFNGFFRAVSPFADPVTVKKVRFIKGPDGKGGGKKFDLVVNEFFDAETKAWLVAEMMENRLRWKDLARRKSWLAALITADGTRHGWWEQNTKRKSKFNSEAEEGFDEDKLAPAVLSEHGHDIRGCPSFIQTEACVRMTNFAIQHSSRGKLTNLLVCKSAKKSTTVPVNTETDRSGGTALQG